MKYIVTEAGPTRNIPKKSKKNLKINTRNNKKVISANQNLLLFTFFITL